MLSNHILHFISTFYRDYLSVSVNADKRLLVNDPAYTQNVMSEVMTEVQHMKLHIQNQDLKIQILESKLANGNTNNCTCTSGTTLVNSISPSRGKHATALIFCCDGFLDFLKLLLFQLCVLAIVILPEVVF